MILLCFANWRIFWIVQSACQNYGIMKLQYKGCSLSISVFLVFNECISLGAQLQSDKDVKLLKSHSAMIKWRLSTSSFCLLPVVGHKCSQWVCPPVIWRKEEQISPFFINTRRPLSRILYKSYFPIKLLCVCWIAGQSSLLFRTFKRILFWWFRLLKGAVICKIC